jgi:serine-type D-Ala-D-Ala carboxypeptidase/endopeptidase
VTGSFAQAPRLAAAVEDATRRAESAAREPDEIDLLDALIRQREAVAGKALAMYDVSKESRGDGVAIVRPRQCLDVLREAEDFAAADGSFFVATEHVLYALMRPGAAAWDVVANAGVDPRLVRGQAATEASELGRPTETAEVRARASGIATAWRGPSAPRSGEGQGASTAEEAATRLVASDAVAGLAVITAGPGGPEIAVRGTRDGAGETEVQADTPFRIGSLTKVLTAMAALALSEGGMISLDVPVGDFLQNLRVSPQPGPTLRELLTHTGGAPAGAYLHTPGETAPPFARFVHGDVALDSPPRERWTYSNIGYAIVGQALEDAAGVPFERLLDERVLRPLGMTSTTVKTGSVEELPTGYWIDRGEVVAAPKRDIILRAAGGAVSTPSDVALLLGFLASPADDPQRPISPQAAASMFEPQDRHVGPAGNGAGLAFRLRSIDGNPAGWHPGRISGFPSAIYVAPRTASAVLANTETLAAAPAAATALRNLLLAASK